MSKSMTGFGRYEVSEQDLKITVEIKSVNHRYCDLSIKMPRKWNFMENIVRSEMKKYASRGKIDVFVTYEDVHEGQEQLKYNKGIAASYVEGMQILSHDFGVEYELNTYQLARFPDVFVSEEQQLDEEMVQELLLQEINGAGERFVQSRMSEGDHLKQDLMQKLDELLVHIDFIEERAPEILKEYRQKLMDKAAELLGDTQIDEHVLASEMVVYADKICVDEETVRLRSHVIHMKDTLGEKESVGRKLDFIAQEMNREANTILSKANDIEVSNHAIDLKTEIEKIREQIQNIE